MKIIFEVRLTSAVVEQVEAMNIHGDDKDEMLINHAEDLVALGEYKVRFREEKEDEQSMDRPRA